MKTMLTLVIFLSGCASVAVEKLKEVPELGAGCKVAVFTSKEEAIKEGPLEEMCIISAYPSSGLNATITGALQNGKTYACSCGADNVYIKEERGANFGSAPSVTLVGFRRIK